MPDSNPTTGALPVFTEVISKGVMRPSWQAGPGTLSRRHLPGIEKAVVIDVRNVCDYVYAVPQEQWGIVEDVPNIAPPFPLMWLEGRMPSLLVSEVTGVSRVPAGRRFRWGVLLLSLRAKRRVGRDEIQKMGLFLASGGRPDYLQNELDLEAPDDLDAEWVLTGSLFVQMPHGPVVGPACTRVLAAGSDGVPLWTSRDIVWSREHLSPEVLTEALGEGMGVPFTEALLGVSFMHCRNVEVVERSTSPTKKQRRRGEPVVRYRVLKVDAITKMLEQQGEATRLGLSHALHVCRGHFKTYTDDAPLFGKSTGTWFWGDHVRGSAAHGIVVKDYETAV